MAKSVRPPSSGWIWRWLKILGIVCAILLVLVFIAYFVVTGSGFFQGVILPRVSKAIGADVTVSDADIHPFSSVVLHDLKVQVKGMDPILEAKEVHANYSLWAIIHGNIVVSDVEIDSPTISLVTLPDGTSNLPKPPPSPPQPAKEKQPAKPSKPPLIDIQKVTIKNATVRQTRQFDNGKSNFTELSGFNFSVANLKNGETAKLSIAFDATMANNPPDITQAGSLFASANGDFSIALTPDLKPGSVQGGLKLTVSKATGALGDLSALTALLQSDMTPTEIKQFSLSFQRSGAVLGEISASGPFDVAKTEGKVNVQVRSIDRQVLNILGASQGLDFGTTTINSTNDIAISQAGKAIAVTGTFNLDKLQVKHAGQTTPSLDLDADYQVNVDLDKQSAVLGKLSLAGTENNASILRGDLTSPMDLSWGGTAASAGDASLTVAVNNFNLADWRAVIGDMIPGGIVNVNLKLLSQNSGNKLAIDLTAGIDDLAATVASNHVSQVGINFSTHVDATDLKQFQIANYQLAVTHAKEPAVSVSGNGSYDKTSGAADVQANVQANVPALLAVVPQPNVSAQSGTVQIGAHVTQKSGNKLAVDLTAAVADLTVTASNNHISQMGADFSTHVDATDLKQFQIASYQLSVSQAKQSVASVTGKGTYDLAGEAADIQADVQANLAGLLAMAPQPTMSAQSGTVKVSAHVTQKQKTQSITGDLSLTDFTGKFGANEFQDYSSDLTYDVGMEDKLIQLKKIAGALRQAGNAGGTFNLSGQYDTGTESAKIDAKLDGLNENAVRPFLEAALGGKKLVSVNINATVSAQYDPKGAAAFTADAQVANLVVSDPKADKPAAPLAAGLKADASWQNQIASVKNFQITLTPTDRAKNQIQLQGQVDMTKTNAIQGGVKLSADSIDLTSYYDLFHGQTNTATGAPAAAAKPAPAQTASTGPSQPQTEPAAVELPFHNFTVNASIGALYLHELEIVNFLTTLKMDGGHIWLNPFTLTLNGRPVTANVDLNLGVPGYQYNISFNADTLPLPPIVDTFQPDRKGQISGTLSASAQIKGAGITGAGLQKNLNGQFDVTTTNMNLLVVNLRSPVMVVLLNFIGSISDIIKNPASILTLNHSDTGLAGKINNSPVNNIFIHGTAGNGLVNVKQATVEGTLFKVDASGTVTLDKVLTNSAINFPVLIALERGVATEFGLGSLSTSTNSPFIELPQIATMIGTIGSPQVKRDNAAIAKIALTAGIGAGQGVVGLYNQFTGAATNSASSTNSVINQGEQLFNGLFGKPKKKK